MRPTSKQLEAAVARLSEALDKDLAITRSHKYVAVHVGGLHGALGKELVSSDRLRDAIDQVWAALNAIEVLKGDK